MSSLGLRQRLSLFVRAYKDLPTPIYALVLAKTLSALGAFVDPFLTLLLSVHVGLPATQIGWIIGSLGLFSIIGSVVGGEYSDRYSHRVVLLTGTAIAGSSYLVAGFFADSLYVLPWIALSNVGIGMMRPASSAITAEITPKAKRQLSFSLIHMGINLGFALGPLIASLFVHTHPNWIFWGDGITTLGGLCIVTWGTRNLVYLSSQDNSPEEQPMQGSIFLVLRKRPKILLYMLGSVLFSLSYGQVNFSLPLSLESAIGTDGSRFFGIAMATNGFFVLLWTPIVASMLYVRPMWALATTGLLYAISFSSYYFIPDIVALFADPERYALLALIVISTIVWTAGEVITVSFGNVFLANESPSSHRGRINSSMMVVGQIARFITPVVMGYVIDGYGVDTVWLIAGVSGILAAVTFAWGKLKL